jgi:H+/Cl- antiporter ClcA
MNFEIIPIAEASVTTLMQSISRVIFNPLIILCFALAIVYFLYGLVKYLLSPDNEEIRKNSKSQMLWGIVGMFIMVGVFGIMRLVLTTVGEDEIKIDSKGNYEVLNIK